MGGARETASTDLLQTAKLQMKMGNGEGARLKAKPLWKKKKKISKKMKREPGYVGGSTMKEGYSSPSWVTSTED